MSREKYSFVLSSDNIWLVVAVIVVVFFQLTSAWVYFDHNDFFYLAAASRTGELYNNLHFVQAPLSYWFWRLVYVLSPETYAYPIARFVSSLLAVSSVILVALIFKKNDERIFFIILCAASYYVMRMGFEIGSYSLPAFLLATGIYLALNNTNSGWWALFFGLAASAKLSFSLFFIPGLAMFFLMDRSDNSFFQKLLTWVIWYLFGALLIIIYMLNNLDAFLFHNLSFHSDITNKARGLTAFGSVKSIIFGFGRFIQREALAFGILSSAMLALFVPSLSGLKANVLLFIKDAKIWFVFSISAIAAAISPMIMFDQYLSFPAVILFILVTFFYSSLSGLVRSAFFWIIISISMVSSLPNFTQDAIKIFKKASAVDDHSRASKELSTKVYNDQLVAQDCTDTVFTLSGSLVVDSGLTLSDYTEGGPFWIGKQIFMDKKYSFKNVNYQEYLSNPMPYLINHNIRFVLIGFYLDREQGFEYDFLEKHQRLSYSEVGRLMFLGKEMILFENDVCKR